MENSIHTIKMESNKEHYGHYEKSKEQVKKLCHSQEWRGKANKNRNEKKKWIHGEETNSSK